MLENNQQYPGSVTTHPILDEKLDGNPPSFDFDFLLSIIDPLPLLLPMTPKRGLWWMALLIGIAGISVTEYHYKYFNTVASAFEENLLPVMIFYLAYEPAILTLAILYSYYPDEEEYQQFINNQNTARQEMISTNHNPSLAIIIPCHNSADCIAQTVRSCLNHTAPERIYIMDNGQGEEPSDNTKEVVHSIHAEIRYFYLAKTANKTLAMLIGALYLTNHHPEVTLALLIDDDVLVPPEFSIRHELLADPCIRGVVYPILADSPYKHAPLISRYQDLEYKISDLEMAFLDRTWSVIRPHGAASLWHISTLLEVLYKHNAIFKGDDVMMGHILQHIYLPEGYAKLRIDQFCHFKTTVPQSIVGPPPNLYQQRVRSWNEAQFLYPWNLVLKPLLTIWDRPPAALISIKNSQFYNLHTQVMHIMRFPLMAIYGRNPLYWAVLAGAMLLHCLQLLFFNYAKLPARLRSDWLCVSTYPAYKTVEAVMGTLAFLRVLLASGANAPHNPSVEEMIAQHQLTLPNSFPSPQSKSPSTLSLWPSLFSISRLSPLNNSDTNHVEMGEVVVEQESIGLDCNI